MREVGIAIINCAKTLWMSCQNWQRNLTSCNGFDVTWLQLYCNFRIIQGFLVIT